MTKRITTPVPTPLHEVTEPDGLRKYIQDLGEFQRSVVDSVNSFPIDQVSSVVVADADITATPFRWYLVDATAGQVTMTLPSASKAKYLVLTFKKIDVSANAMVVDGNGAETVDGAANQSTTTQYDLISVVSDGTSWHVV